MAHIRGIMARTGGQPATGRARGRFHDENRSGVNALGSLCRPPPAHAAHGTSFAPERDPYSAVRSATARSSSQPTLRAAPVVDGAQPFAQQPVVLKQHAITHDGGRGRARTQQASRHK